MKVNGQTYADLRCNLPASARAHPTQGFTSIISSTTSSLTFLPSRVLLTTLPDFPSLASAISFAKYFLVPLAEAFVENSRVTTTHGTNV